MAHMSPSSVDPLLQWRSEFPILDTCTYLVNHSLGAMPRAAEDGLHEFATEWRTRGVRAWHEGWWEIGRTTGDLLAPLLGVRPGTISMHQNVTAAQAIVASCFSFDARRPRVVTSELEFPSNIYLFEGFRRYGAELIYIRSGDGVTVPTERTLAAIDDRTALVVASVVLFKSAFIQDAAAIVEKASHVGARVVLDVYQATGAVPLEIEKWGADFAVGGSVKWLCGGPGAGFLYVRPDVAGDLTPAVTGWAAHAEPFAFEAGPTRYALDPAERFQTGTPNVPALYAARGAYRIINEVGVDAIREKSLRLTRRIIDHALARGYRLNTPLDDHLRGGTVVIDVPDGQRVTDELIRRNVIVDYRPGAGVRIAPHFYNSEDEVDGAMAALDDIVEGSQGSGLRTQASTDSR
jgi:kynureninase